MSLRLKFILYLTILHAAFGGLSYILFLENRYWLFAIEIFFIISYSLGIHFINVSRKSFDIAETGMEILKEGDFVMHFREIGQLEVDRLIKMFNEMVDQLRNERLKVEEQNLFLDKLISATSSGLIILNYDKQITHINPAAASILLFFIDSAKGKKLSEIDLPVAADLDKVPMNQSVVLTFKGSRRLKCRKSSFIDKGFERYFIVIDELTDELRQTEKISYEKLIRMMSHEISNTVGAVNSLLQSCLKFMSGIKDNKKDNYTEALEIAMDRSTNLNDFMRGFADVVKLPEPRLMLGDINSLVRKIALLFQNDTEHIQWNFDLDEHLPEVEMDANQIEQVFINIYKNAIEAIEQQGTILVTSKQSGGKVLVVLEDNGTGLSQDVTSGLFTPFFSTKKNGQGIGLTITAEILNRHNFSFTLETLHNGNTAFTIVM